MFSELLPRHRPCVALTVKGKGYSVLHHRRVALHEASHAVAWLNTGVQVDCVEMLVPAKGRYGWKGGGYYSRCIQLQTPQQFMAGAATVGSFAGIAADALCDTPYVEGNAPADLTGVVTAVPCGRSPQ